MRFESTLTWKGKELNTLLENEAKALVEALCKQAQAEIRQDVDVPPARSGRWYVRTRFVGYRPKPIPGVPQPLARDGKPGGHRDHQASAPGERPARDYGWLLYFISYKTKRKAAGVYEGVVGPDLKQTPYARNLEYGIGIAPRPFMRPAFDENKMDWLQYAEDHAKGAIRNSGL